MISSTPPGINVVMVILGVFFVLGAFFATGVRGAFGSGPTRPPTPVERLIFFAAGLLALMTGLYGLLK